MTEWKKQTELIGQTFQLVDLKVEERFQIWDNTARRFLRELDQIKDNKGGYSRVGDDHKYMKAKDFAELYPNMRKSTQFIRLIVLNGDTYSVGFSKTVDDQLQQAVKTLASVGKSATDVGFLLTKEGEGLKTKYHIEIITGQDTKLQVFNTPDGETIVGEEKDPTLKAAAPEAPTKPFDPDAFKAGLNNGN